MKGSDFGKSLLALDAVAREKAILQTAIAPENLPAWLRGPWAPVKMGERLTVYASPDYFAAGEDEDFVRLPMTPWTAEVIADRYGAILPTRKIVVEIYRQATQKLPSVTFTPDAKMESTARMLEHDAAIDKTVKGVPGPKNLLAGHKKDVVVGPDLDGSRVAIYGWQPDPKMFPHQPYSTVHDSKYVDYSHGVRLVSRQATLDGQPVDLMDVFRDPKLVELVSDQGQFVPVFPNKNANFPAPASAVKKVVGFLAGAAFGGSIGGPVGAVFGGIAGAALSK